MSSNRENIWTPLPEEHEANHIRMVLYKFSKTQNPYIRLNEPMYTFVMDENGVMNENTLFKFDTILKSLKKNSSNELITCRCNFDSEISMKQRDLLIEAIEDLFRLSNKLMEIEPEQPRPMPRIENKKQQGFLTFDSILVGIRKMLLCG